MLDTRSAGPNNPTSDKPTGNTRDLGPGPQPAALKYMSGIQALVQLPTRALLAAGADRTIRDNKHDSAPLGWAEFFGRIEIVRLLGSATS